MTDPDKPQDPSKNIFNGNFHFFEKIADLSSNILFVVDLQEMKPVYVSQKAKELLGYDTDYLVSLGTNIFKDFVHPEDYEMRMKSLEKCRILSEEDECEVEARLRTGDNKWEWYRITEKIFRRDESGEVSHAIGTAHNIHAQKLNEEKLREEHRRLRDAQRIGHIGSFERELPGEIMHCSEELYRILGIEPRANGMNVEEFYTFIHPDDRQVLQDAVAKTHSTGQTFDTITRIIRPDKSIRHVHRKAALIKDEKGNPLRVYGTLQDITARIKAEEERQRAEKLMRSTEILANMGSYEVDQRDNSVYFSEGLFRLFGEEPGSLEPSLEWIDQRSHPEDVLPIKEILSRAMENKTSYTYTRRIYRKDGSLRTLEVHGRFLSDSDDGSIKIIGLVQDITERKMAEEDLLRSETRNRNLLEVLQNAPDAYLVLSADLHIQMASDAYLETSGTQRDEIIGKHLFNVFPDNPEVPNATGVQNLEASLKKVLSLKKAHRMAIQQYDVRSRDGKFVKKYWSPTNTPVINSKGEVEYIIHRVLDITEIKKEQAALKGKISETEMLKTSLEEIKLQAQKLKNNKALLQSVFDASPNSIILYKIIYDDQGRAEDFTFVMANEFNHLTLNIPRNIVGERFSEVFPHVKETNVLEEYKRTADTGIPADFEVWYEGDGFKNWFHFRVTKKDNYLVATAEDITERKQTEETVQQMLNGSISSITILESVRNEKGEIIDFLFKGANKAAEKVNQVSRNKLLGNRLLELFPGVKESFFESYVKVVETGVPLRVQRSYSGEHFNHWFDVSAVKNGDGFIMTFLDITDQKKAEKELLELKEEITQRATDKYQKIINSMDEGFCILEIIRDETGKCVDYKYLETNPVFEVQTGMKNVLGKNVSELIPNLEDYWKEIYGKVALSGKSVRFEDYAEAMGKWFDVNAFRIDSPNEQHVAIIFKDITERKEIEERQTFLLHLNEALRPLEDPSKIQETSMHILGSHLEVNRALYSEVLEDQDTLTSRLGYHHDAEPVTGVTKLSGISSEGREQLLNGITYVKEDMRTLIKDNPYALQKISASQVCALIAVPLLKQGKLHAIVSVQQKVPRKWTALEITLVEEVCEQTWKAMEKAQAEKALRESEQRFRNLVESSALATWETGPDGKILKDSPSWRFFSGQSFKEWIGDGWLNAVHAEDRAYVKREWQEAVRHQHTFDIEYRILSATGSFRWTNVKAIPIFDIEGRVTKWSGMNIDIHDNKMAEEALIKAKEEAEEASKAKEDFLSTMSHEIRTPLNAVIGLTNLLLDKDPREDQIDDLSSLRFSAKNLLALINDILDYSKLEAGKAQVTHTDFDLPDLLTGLKQAHTPLAKEKHTSLELYIGENIPTYISTDQLKLSQVLHNLVSNAVKFTDRGKVKISAIVEKSEGDTIWLKFEVADTGIGIKKDKLGHIFEKFAQAESSTVRQFGGTGLGLSITRLLLDLMGSKIKVESTPGKGSSFYFSLAVKKADSSGDSPALPSQFNEIDNLEDLKVLLVEDVEINRKIILQFLKNWWHLEPDEAKNGREAVEMAKKNRYELILMDIRMPVMDGYEATEKIRSLEGYQDIPILALTADKSQEVLQKDHATKFTGLLTKPFEPLDLKKKILLHLPAEKKKLVEVQKEPLLQPSPDITLEDQMKEEEFVPLVLSQLKLHKTEFMIAVKQADKQQLENLQHRTRMLFEMLRLNKLAQIISEAMENLVKGTIEKKRQDLLEAGEILFKKAISRIEDEIPEPSYNISRYLTLAGKNKKVLQKLIGNSIGTMEQYRNEFWDAANQKDVEKISDLIHKNTTSLHYLQANRLKNEINEYREILKTGNTANKELEQKRNEIMLSFSILISQLKALDD